MPYNALGQVKSHPQHKVRDVRDLHMGDHLALPRWSKSDRGDSSMYSHHAILEAINYNEKTLQIIHYLRNAPKKTSQKGKGLVVRGTLNFRDEEIFLVEHDGDICSDPDVVVERGKSKLGETKYNLFTNNCEHFAQWCKTGCSRSEQIRVKVKVAGKVAGQFALTVAGHFARLASKSGIKSLLNLTVRAASRLTKATVVLAFAGAALQIALVIWDIVKARKLWKAGRLSRKDYHEAAVTRLRVGGGELFFMVAGSVIGLAIAGPAGACVGGLLGNPIWMILGVVFANVRLGPGELCDSNIMCIVRVPTWLDALYTRELSHRCKWFVPLV